MAFGDVLDDLYIPFHFWTGEHLNATETDLGEVNFAWAAYMNAIRDRQATLPPPVSGRNYPLQLRTIYRIGTKVQLVVEDETLDRPLTVELPDPATQIPAEQSLIEATYDAAALVLRP